MRRSIAGILSILVFLTFLLSSAFISVEADHDCEGEDCAICRCIDMCLTVLKVTAIAVSLCFAVNFFERQKDLCLLLENIICRKTPTDLKIQLNN